MKAVVHYDTKKPYGMAGKRFFCHPIDHTSPLVSNTKEVLTSEVVWVHEDGSVETQNSLYVPKVNEGH